MLPRLGAEDLALAEAGDDAGLERLRPRLRRWLRGDPGPDGESLVEALGEYLSPLPWPLPRGAGEGKNPEAGARSADG